ncbi:pyruvate dehydrogenase (acetyl-transferring) E1 component subunit alpha [Candidatus Desantisbacteria bacterium CG07_land_8_20_14_0_80_39_15]|nr:MAG: pyruvate dehydrogenase (acetyl-transferring) E1 component subunit alpha [Candidatus Desantisbacteria bacterium CG07_land_8_20_14_0_80_39_15]
MHLFDKETGFLGGNGIMGAGIPIALGAAYRAKYKNSNQVCVCFFGDGSSTQGTFHESLNISALWKLPLIYICENNLYAVSTPVSEEVSIPNVGDRACAYGIPGKVIDGQDVIKVHNAVNEAVKRARDGQGPTLIECKTYRYYPHCMIIKETRQEEEIKEWKEKDPIVSFEKKLLKEKMISLGDLEKMKQELEKEMDEAENFARESPYPDVENFKKEISDLKV